MGLSAAWPQTPPSPRTCGNAFDEPIFNLVFQHKIRKTNYATFVVWKPQWWVSVRHAQWILRLFLDNVTSLIWFLSTRNGTTYTTFIVGKPLWWPSLLHSCWILHPMLHVLTHLINLYLSAFLSDLNLRSLFIYLLMQYVKTVILIVRIIFKAMTLKC